MLKVVKYQTFSKKNLKKIVYRQLHSYFNSPYNLHNNQTGQSLKMLLNVICYGDNIIYKNSYIILYWSLDISVVDKPIKTKDNLWLK